MEYKNLKFKLIISKTSYKINKIFKNNFKILKNL